MIDLQDLSDDDLLKKFENGIYEVAKRSSVTSLNYPILLAEHVDDCREDLKRRLSERNQWQDIATAPKDKTEILACDEEGTRAIISFFKPGEVLFGKIFSISYTNPRIEGSFSAKYWMPLQDPPKGD